MKKRRREYLFGAVKSGDLYAVRSLLAEGSDIRVMVNDETVMFRSIVSNYYQITEMLVQYDSSIVDSSINYAEDKPLHLAIRMGEMHMVQLLLQYNANPSLANKMKRTPLHEAIRRKEVELVRLLIYNGGADVNLRENSFSPLHLSAIYGNMSSIQLLLENGANITAVTGSGSTARNLCERSNPSNVQAFDQAVLAAQRAISENILIITKSLEHSSQLACLPYLADCFGLIGDYVGGYGRRLESSVVNELAAMEANQAAKVGKRKQCAESAWVVVKRHKEAEEESSSNENKADEECSGKSSSDAPDSFPGGDGIRASSASYSAEQPSDQQQSMESDQPLPNSPGQRQFIYDEVVDTAESGEALLMKLFIWLQDLPEGLQQRMLGLLTELLEALEPQDKFVSAQLNLQSIEERFEADSRKYYEQDNYLDNSQDDYARAGQADAVISFVDTAETITMSGAVVNSLHKHDLQSDAFPTGATS
jgi:ankyrin repeat protein